MDVAQTLEEIGNAIAAPSTRWQRLDDVEGSEQFTGTGHPEWIFYLFRFHGSHADGAATNVKRGLVVRFTPQLTAQAELLARKAG
jgi:hypothetical protein